MVVFHGAASVGNFIIFPKFTIPSRDTRDRKGLVWISSYTGLAPPNADRVKLGCIDIQTIPYD